MNLKPVIASYSGESYNNIIETLTDDHLELIGKIDNESLKHTAEEFNIIENGKLKDVLVDEETFRSYSTIVQEIMTMSYNFYKDNLNIIHACLRNTLVGQQGVPVENMMMHFWRYCRKVMARELYELGFFTDNAPKLGSITVFYENDIEELQGLFG